jgi:hypothetical protein
VSFQFWLLRLPEIHTRRIVSIFAWGVRNDLVQETTWRALKTVKSLRKGDEGTFDNAERQTERYG